MSVLRFQGVTKKYGDKVAVDNLTLEVNAGEICAFIGHNGAGKTTAIKSLCGILPFEEGEIYVGDNEIKREPLACKRDIAYIPDNPDLYDFMTGIAYLNFIADVFGISAEKREEKIRNLSRALELTSDLALPISAYSHGMKQKLAVISALLHEPRVWVMDEPFVGLDPKASHKLKEMMREFTASGGAIFFSTHVLDVAEKLCDKVAIIQNGKLVVFGNMDEVRGDASLEKVFLDLSEG